MDWKRLRQILSALAAGAMWILAFPVVIEEGAETWQRWLGISDIPAAASDAINILYQQFGWPSTLLAVAVTVWWWFHWYPPRWFRRLREAQRLAATAPTTTPIEGIPELERCHAALVEYIASCTDKYPIGQQDIAASQKFLPHVVRLYRLLDEQNISHPPIRRGVTFTGTGELGRFLAELMAVQHDIKQARRVYQGDRT